MKALLQLHGDLFIAFFTAYMKEQSAAVSLSLDFKISSSTQPQPGFPPFQRTATGFVPTPSSSQLLPVQADTLIMMALSNSSSYDYTIWTAFACFLPSFPPSLWQVQAPWFSLSPIMVLPGRTMIITGILLGLQYLLWEEMTDQKQVSCRLKLTHKCLCYCSNVSLSLEK